VHGVNDGNEPIESRLAEVMILTQTFHQTAVSRPDDPDAGKEYNYNCDSED
jgi:hypothetical protein